MMYPNLNNSCDLSSTVPRNVIPGSLSSQFHISPLAHNISAVERYQLSACCGDEDLMFPRRNSNEFMNKIVSVEHGNMLLIVLSK